MKTLALAIALAAVAAPAHANLSQRATFELSCTELLGAAERLLAETAKLSSSLTSIGFSSQQLMVAYQMEAARLNGQMAHVRAWRRYQQCPQRY